MPSYILALDQGTTSSRAIIFDEETRQVAMAQQEFPQIFPQPGWVEHDPEAIWDSQLACARAALQRANIGASQLAGIGIANQRETVVAWERDTGKPIANAIVWQCRRTADVCDRLRHHGWQTPIHEKTGLQLDPYFSATKIDWLLDHASGARARAERGEVIVGTIDSFLIFRLTGGRVHVTDESNASRTMLYNIREHDWDEGLLGLFNVPREALPTVVSSSEIYGETDPTLLGAAVPIGGALGDQQAALFGQACLQPGMAKNTYGTGSFLLMNTGDRLTLSRHGLLSTVAWNLGGQTTYALEGSIFVTGAAIQWLRDGLGLIANAAETEALARSVADNGGVVFVPALAGLGAPHWDPYARGAIFGLTRGTTRAHLVRATLEAMAYQTRELVEAMAADSGVPLTELRVDGGAVSNNFLLQFQADTLNVDVVRPACQETTALGAALAAGLATGVWADPADAVARWREERRYHPMMPEGERDRLCGAWGRAVKRAGGWVEPAAQ